MMHDDWHTSIQIPECSTKPMYQLASRPRTPAHVSTELSTWTYLKIPQRHIGGEVKPNVRTDITFTGKATEKDVEKMSKKILTATVE
jgi:hypothetical protein